jgi:hypothetical protein
MSPPKHIVSAATIVLNNQGNILLIKGSVEDGKFLAVKLKKENHLRKLQLEKLRKNQV